MCNGKELCNIKKHPAIFCMIIIQVLMLAILIISSSFTERAIYSIDVNSFKCDNENVTIQDGTLCITEQNGINNENQQNIVAEGIGFPSGTYTMDIVYDSYVDSNKISENNASVSISSRWHINFDTITLDDRHTQVTGKLWIPFWSGCNDLRINISYNGKGSLFVKSITFTESLRYRVMRIVGFLGLFVLFDLIIIILFSDIKLKIKKEYGMLVLIAATASIPFCMRTLLSVDGQDLWFHLRRIVSISEEIGNGQFPVRMATELNNGYGYPTPIYYCDLFLYPVAILYRCSVPLRMCYQIYVILINSITTIFTYISLGKITKKTSIKLLGTGLYVLAVYRLVNIVIRSAVGEYTAMAFLPLIVAGLYLIYTKEKPDFGDWLYLSIGMAGVIMSHVLTGEMIAINIVILCLVLLRKTLRKERILAFIKAAAVCIGITVWFLVPFLDYYVSHVTVVQKGDLRILEDNTQELINLFQIFSPGKSSGHYLTLGFPLVLGIGIILYALINYKGREYSKGKLLRIMSGFAFLNIAFVCKYFPWGRIQRHLGIEGLGYQIGTIQFSWRFLSVATVLLVFAIVIALTRIAERNDKRFEVLCYSLIGCIVISVGFFYYKCADEMDAWPYNTSQPYSNSDNLYLLDGTDRSKQDTSMPEVVSGDAVVKTCDKNQGVFQMYLENKDASVSEVQAPIYNYKYYHAYDENGNLLQTNFGKGNYIIVEIPESYNGFVFIKFEEPVIWRFSEAVSFIVVLILCGKLFVEYRKKKTTLTENL